MLKINDMEYQNSIIKLCRRSCEALYRMNDKEITAAIKFAKEISKNISKSIFLELKIVR